MPKPAREVIGIRRGTSPPEEIRAIIHEAEPNEGQDDASCLVHCPAVLEADKRVAGVDNAQAMELSEMFIEQMFDFDDIDVIDIRAL